VKIQPTLGKPRCLTFLVILQSFGARTIAAEALRALVRERPDLIVADIAIVEEDGYELLSRVRDRRRGQPCFSGRPGRQAAIVIVRD